MNDNAWFWSYYEALKGHQESTCTHTYTPTHHPFFRHPYPIILHLQQDGMASVKSDARALRKEVKRCENSACEVMQVSDRYRWTGRNPADVPLMQRLGFTIHNYTYHIPYTPPYTTHTIHSSIHYIHSYTFLFCLKSAIMYHYSVSIHLLLSFSCLNSSFIHYSVSYTTSCVKICWWYKLI